MRSNLTELPPDLPIPIDDGLTDHLVGLELPAIELKSTERKSLNIWQELQKPSVLFIYPRAGSPLEPNMNPHAWDQIPGARGCTPHSCGYRDLKADFDLKGVSLFGLSVQSPAVQDEFAERNLITFPILSDYQYKLTDSLNLPTFDFEGTRLIKRMALYIVGAKIVKVFYPVFPPNKNAADVLAWLQAEERL